MKNAIDRIQDALRERGYRTLVRHLLFDKDAMIIAYTLYTNGKTTLILEEHRDGGCDLYKPVFDGLSIEKTIGAIPT